MTQSPEAKPKQIQHRPAPPGYADASWSGVKPTAYAGVKAAFSANAFPLYVHGPTGTGKTCLAALVYQSFARQPLWHRCDALLLSLTTGRTSDSAVTLESAGQHGGRVRRKMTFEKYLDKFEHAPLVILDDLAVRAPTEAMQQVFFDLLELRKGQRLLITGNLPPEDLRDLYDDRIVSRILAGTVLELAGADRREGQGKRYKAED
jgi:chromosomal replication initiator protein